MRRRIQSLTCGAVLLPKLQSRLFDSRGILKYMLSKSCWMLVSAQWVEISIKQGTGEYYFALRIYSCQEMEHNFDSFG